MSQPFVLRIMANIKAYLVEEQDERGALKESVPADLTPECDGVLLREGMSARSALIRVHARVPAG